MEFDKSKVYTSLNAEEVKVGSKVVVANTILELERNCTNNKITRIVEINPYSYENRFKAYYKDNEAYNYNLCYLVSELEDMWVTDDGLSKNWGIIMKKLKYKRFTNETISILTRYKEDLLCQFINENRIEQKDIQKIYINDYEIQLFYWEE